MIESPSKPIWNSVYSIALAAQACFSSSLIGLEASLKSVSSLQNFLKPPPVPEIPTVTLTSGWTFLNSSATASVIGKTVLEPSPLILPDTFGLVTLGEVLLPVVFSSSLPQAERAIATKATRPRAAASRNRLRRDAAELIRR